MKTPRPGRNLPEDTCCLDLSVVTGLSVAELHPGQNFNYQGSVDR
jgi:hypothetical protein